MGARNILRLFNDALAGEDQSVEQLTSTTTETTLNSVTGTIETYPSNAAAGAVASFTFKNDKIKAGSLVLVSVGNYLQARGISAISNATDAVFTTTGNHNLAVGDVVTVIGSVGNTDADVANGRHTVTEIVDSNEFKAGVNTTGNTFTLDDAYANPPIAKRDAGEGLGEASVKASHSEEGQCKISISNDHASQSLTGSVPVRFIVLD
tara:strand:- start:1191 stop:1811 length:621 start_codon:yes stop_codon:yes gene_type:complete